MLSKQALEEYKEIHHQETGGIISDEKLVDEAINLLTLFNFVCRPIKKEWLKEYGREIQAKSIQHKENKITSCGNIDRKTKS
jgi:hypothetical protein